MSMSYIYARYQNYVILRVLRNITQVGILKNQFILYIKKYFTYVILRIRDTLYWLHRIMLASQSRLRIISQFRSDGYSGIQLVKQLLVGLEVGMKQLIGFKETYNYYYNSLHLHVHTSDQENLSVYWTSKSKYKLTYLSKNIIIYKLYIN